MPSTFMVSLYRLLRSLIISQRETAEMVHEQLSKIEQDLILRCMVVLATTDLIEDWEFAVRVSITKQALLRLIAAWPHLERVGSLYGNIAINNCLNEIVHAFAAEQVARYNLSQADAEQVFKKWLSLNPDLPQQKILTDEEAEVVKAETYRRVNEVLAERRRETM